MRKPNDCRPPKSGRFSITQQLFRAIKFGDLNMVKFLLKNNYTLQRARLGNFGDSPLTLAVRFNRARIVYFLLDYEVDVNYLPKSGMGAVHLAAKLGNVNILTALLKAGADPNLKCIIYENGHPLGWSPMHFAADEGHFKCVDELLYFEADPDVYDAIKATPLDLAGFNLVHYGCINSSLEISSLLFGEESERMLKPEGSKINQINAETRRLYYEAIVELSKQKINTGSTELNSKIYDLGLAGLVLALFELSAEPYKPYRHQLDSLSGKRQIEALTVAKHIDMYYHALNYETILPLSDHFKLIYELIEFLDLEKPRIQEKYLRDDRLHRFALLFWAKNKQLI